MRTLKIQFTRPRAWLKPMSWLIRLFQRTPYSHVRFCWISSTGIEVIYEASGSNVKFIGPLAAKENPITVIEEFSFELDQAEYRNLIKSCMTYAGISYSIPQIISIGLMQLGLCKNCLARDHEYAQVCSELVIRVLKDLNINLELDPDTAGPKEVYKALEEWFNGDSHERV